MTPAAALCPVRAGQRALRRSSPVPAAVQEGAADQGRDAKGHLAITPPPFCPAGVCSPGPRNRGIDVRLTSARCRFRARACLLALCAGRLQDQRDDRVAAEPSAQGPGKGASGSARVGCRRYERQCCARARPRYRPAGRRQQRPGPAHAAHAGHSTAGNFLPALPDVLGLLAPADLPDAQPRDDPMQQALAKVTALDQANPARKPLMSMIVDAQGDRDRFRRSLEHWYDDAMDRVSGWYKRYVQRIILAISIVLVVTLNIDTINIAQVLWHVPTERAAVASAAAAHVAAGSNASTSADQQVRAITALNLPLGWAPQHAKSAPSTDPRHVPVTLGSWLIKLLGLVLTVLALSLGAPFWFDALSKLAQLRQSGPKPVKS